MTPELKKVMNDMLRKGRTEAEIMVALGISNGSFYNNLDEEGKISYKKITFKK